MRGGYKIRGWHGNKPRAHRFDHSPFTMPSSAARREANRRRNRAARQARRATR